MIGVHPGGAVEASVQLLFAKEMGYGDMITAFLPSSRWSRCADVVQIGSFWNVLHLTAARSCMQARRRPVGHDKVRLSENRNRKGLAAMGVTRRQDFDLDVFA